MFLIQFYKEVIILGLFDGMKRKDKNTLKTHHLGGCIVTRSVLSGSSRLRWLFREESRNPADNGWRAFGDKDTQEYIDDPNNSIVVDFDRLVEIEPAVLSVFSMPVGTDLEFDADNKAFIDTASDKELPLH